MRRHKGAWMFWVVAMFAWFAPGTVKATPEPGLQTTYYTIDTIPPVKSTTEYPVCGSEIENNINRSYDGELFEDCTYDLFMVHMTGFIDIPEHETIELMLASDDGGTIKIGLDEWGNWNDQGCTWMMSGPLQLDAGSQPLDLWMYENGGGACLMLAWNIDNAGWFIVPDSAFTQQAVATTTTSSTTTSTTTTLSSTTTSTTTTEVSTTTTSSTTTLPISTTTTTEPIQTSTTTLVESTTTSTTTTVQVSPTTTQAPYTPPQTTTTTEPEPSPTTETQPVTTTPETETIVDENDTTEPETFTTYLPYPLEEPVEPDVTFPETVVPDRVDVILPDETEQPTEPQEPQEYTTETTLLEETDSSLTTLPPIIENEEVSEFIENIENATVEELLSNVDTLLEQELSNEELEAVFDAVFNDNLSDEETIELAQEVLNGELDAEEFGTVIDAIFDEVVTDEVLIETFTAVLETELDSEKFEAVVDVLESDVISKEQVAEVVTLIIEQEGGVNAEQATELATSSKVLESIDGEQATEVFDAVVASEVSPEDGAAIVEAVQNAPEEVKEAFEEEINVFEGVFDEYVPTGSSISVAERRAVIAATAVLFVAPLPIPTTSSSQTASSRNKG